MAGLKRFQYVNKDHAAIINDSIARIRQTYGENTWNDFEEDNTGRMLVEIFAYITDLLLFYLDRQANETYLPTATERQNIINMCKLIGYTPKNSKPAQAILVISIEQVQQYDVTLPAGTLVQTQEGISFETQDNAVIPAGELSTSTTILEGETFTEVIGVSNGEPWQNFYLPRSGVMEILNISINDHDWQYVPSLANQLPEAEVFTAEIDAWRRAEIFFGDGRTGRIPDNEGKIIVKYRIGGGTAGNVAPNTINIIRDVAIDSRGNTVHVNVTNPEWATGGAEPESLESIKLWAPRNFETQNRCVTQQNYETFTHNFSGIAKAKAICRERSGEANVIRIYVLSYGSLPGTLTYANETLKESLIEYLNKYKQLTDWLETADGLFTPVNFSGSVIISDGFSQNKISEQINKVLQNLMDIEIRDMGEPLRISDVYAAIDNIEGITSVELETPAQTLTPAANEILVLGNINFSITLRRVPSYGTNF